MTDRRQFLHQITLFSLAAWLPDNSLMRLFSGPRLFKMCINPGAVGVNADLRQLLDWAHQYGFEAIISMPQTLVKMEKAELADFLSEMKAKNISWGSTNVPVQFRNDEQTFQDELRALPPLAAAMERAGASRCNTWIMPTHKTLSYRENFAEHRRRLKEIARILGHYGVRLGLEYVGPKTLMSRDKYAFIHTMKETKELIHAIDEPNVGIQLDSFHWFCAGETAADILTLTKDEIVTVDLNDARKGYSADEQIDGKRELPSATGVIDLKSFLEALVRIGYDGPVRAEPFNAELRDMDDEAALRKTHEMMKKSFDLLG